VLAAAWQVRRGNYTEPLLFVLFAHLALLAIRHVPIFTIAVAPMLAAAVDAGLRHLPAAPVAAWLRNGAARLDRIVQDTSQTDAIGRWHLVSLAGVAATGFSALLTKNNEMTGDRLMLHMSAAPAFALGAVAITLFWAHRNRFAAADWSRLTSAGTWAVPLRKLFFWLGVALTVPTMVSIVAAMFPLFGADGQQDLFRIHRCCAPLLAAAGLLFAYFAAVTWRERSSD